MLTHCSFDTTKNMLNRDRGKNCMKNFCSDLREHVTKIIDYEKKEMIPLTKKEERKYNKKKVCHICKKDLVVMMTIKNTIKYKITVILLENI